MPKSQPVSPRPSEPTQPPVVFPEFMALVVLLGLFLFIGGIALFAIVKGGAEPGH